MDVAIHLRGPLEEAPQAGSLGPQEFPEFQESNLGHLDAGVGLDAPEKIRTAPGGNPVATGGVPKKAQHRPHGVPVWGGAASRDALPFRRDAAARVSCRSQRDGASPVSTD